MRVSSIRIWSSVIIAIALHACTESGEPTATLYPVAAVAISPSQLSVAVGARPRLTARAYDSRGWAVNAQFAWSSADPEVATINNSNGWITTLSVGSTVITATAGALSATAILSVRPEDQAAVIALSPASLSLVVGNTMRLTGIVFDSTGAIIQKSLDWSSADTGIATVGRNDGVITAISAGTTTVTATVGSISATASVSVDVPNLSGGWYGGFATSQGHEWTFITQVGLMLSGTYRDDSYDGTVSGAISVTGLVTFTVAIPGIEPFTFTGKADPTGKILNGKVSGPGMVEATWNLTREGLSDHPVPFR